ncbi:pyrophosphatase DCP2 [Mycena floridula]|nr:pyrophosphatase DCP2 [Mycena floridula]
MSSPSSSSPAISNAAEQEPFSYKQASSAEILEELESRFILNLPDEELASLERICFQIEQAHWFYEDFVREQNNKFPSYTLKNFSSIMFNSCALLKRWAHDHEQVFSTFMQYKTRVPVCGAIMLNDKWDKCVLVKGWKSSSGWGFPKGKINEDEPQMTCAVREVLEETGYNLAAQIRSDHVIEMNIREQKIALYVVPGVPEDYSFKTKTRKEISKIEWFSLADLPTWKRHKAAPGKFYLIAPFILPLRNFIREHHHPSPQRKGAKGNKGGKDGATPSRNGRKERHAPQQPIYSSDPNQESSSQSSDPQTPSTQYSQQIPIVHDAKPNLDPDAIDPHFARLLSSLTLSGAAVKQDKVPLAPLVESPPPSETRDHSTPAPPSPTSEAPSTIVDRQIPRTGVSIDTVNKLFRSQPLSQLQRPISNGPTHPRFSVPQTSPKVSRRTSSTADISPYLPRATEVPASAKHLKQLALLQTVADESARMSPYLAMRSVGPHPHPPASSVPPPPHDPRLLYSSGPSFAQAPPVQPYIQDPYQFRSQTSHAFQRPMYPATGSMSMNQSQLLNLINSRQPVNGSPAFSQQQSHPYYQAPPYGMAPLLSYNQGPMFPGQVPLSAPAMSPGFPRPNPASVPLLSILNGAQNGTV